MDEIDEQLRRLADRRAERTPVTDAAGVMGGGGGKNRMPVWLAAAAVLAVLVGVTAWLIGAADEDGADVADDGTTTVPDEPEPEPTVTEEPGPTSTSVPDGSTTLPDPPTSIVDDSPDDQVRVAATEEGIEILRPGGTTEIVPVGATHVAFLAGETLVHQSAFEGDVRLGDGPVRAGPIGATTPLEVGQGETGFVLLHDAAVIDGRPTALLSRRTGESPETTDVRLLLVDLETRDARDLGRFGGWESGVADGRLADGSIVLLRSTEAALWVQVIDYQGTTLWELDAWVDTPPSDIAVFPGEVWTLDPGWSGDLTTPELRWTRYDNDPTDGEAGARLGEGAVGLTGDVDRLATGYCHRPVRPPATFGVLECDATGGPPVRIDLSTGEFAPIDGLSGGRVTIPRAVAAPLDGATDPFTSFTTDEMEERLAGTHVYLGGSVLSFGAGASIEIWGLGSGPVDEWSAEGGPAEVWLLRLVEYRSDGRPVWDREAVIEVDLLPDETISEFCRLGDEATDGVFAQITTDPIGGGWVAPSRAWRVDYEALTITEVDETIECENPSDGL